LTPNKKHHTKTNVPPQLRNRFAGFGVLGFWGVEFELCRADGIHMSLEENHDATPSSGEGRPSNEVFVLLYLQTFLASFGERLWGFAVPMLLATMYPKNMWPAATLALIETLCGFLSGPSVGAMIDRTGRLAVMRAALIGQFLYGWIFRRLTLFRMTGGLFGCPWFVFMLSLR
jgi:hypothetical protein